MDLTHCCCGSKCPLVIFKGLFAEIATVVCDIASMQEILKDGPET